MKKLLVLLLAASSTLIIGQDLATSIELNRAFGKPILKEKLIAPERFDDLVDHYPHNWIDGYRSTSIKLEREGQIFTASGSNNLLSDQQKKLLTSAAIGDKINIEIQYYYKNSISEKNENRSIYSVYTVIADQEAKPFDKIEVVRSYFLNNSFKKFEDGSGDAFTGASILFTIDTQGKISKASITQSSGKIQADQLLLKALQSMPAWKPAQDRSGKKYAQQFILDVVKSGC